MSVDCHPLYLVLAIMLTAVRVKSANVHKDNELDQFVNLKNSAGFECVLAIHDHVQNCKSTYVQRMSAVLAAGIPKESEVYRKALCCGFWALRDCATDAAKQRCDRQTHRTIQDMNIYSREQENTFLTRCGRFEYGSRLCGRASIQSTSVWTLIVGFCVWALIAL